MKLSYKDMEDLRYAKMLLEHPGLAAKIVNMLGVPFEMGLQSLPKLWGEQVQKASQSALNTALNIAILSLGKKQPKQPADVLHKLVVAASGGVGGFFGLPALSVELPLATTVMLRSIADIAHSEGEDIHCIESKLACVEVFAFGGKARNDDSVETGYYAVRAALSKAVSDAAAYIAEQGIAESGAPILVRLIVQIGSRFGVVVSEKVAASAVPVVGAAGSAMINTIFMDHFQDMAHGHFIIRRLEKIYGKELIEREYNSV